MSLYRVSVERARQRVIFLVRWLPHYIQTLSCTSLTPIFLSKGVRFKVVKVSGVGLLALWKEKKVRLSCLLLPAE